MNENQAVWYLPNEAGQPAGPYSSNQILEQLNTGQMPETTLCWRQGMPDWQPLTEVEPFAAEIKTIKTAAGKRVRRIVIAISCVVCVIAAAAVAYLIMMGPPELRRAKKLMAAGLYTETSEVLGPYVNNNPLNSKAAYLLAIANVYDYATYKTERMGLVGGFWGTKTFLEQAKELLGRAFKADPKLIEKAKTEIADAAVRIPTDVPDALSRSLQISRLQAELNLADKKYLAGELLKKLISQGALQGQYGLPQEAVLQVLDWDSSLGGQIITYMLGDENATSQQLSMIVTTLQSWARERPAFAQVLSKELLNRSKLLVDAGRYEQAKILLPKALEIDPQALKTEDHILLYVRVMDPSNEKLTRCQLFLRDYPDSPRRRDVLLIIVRDATAVSKPYSENLYATTFPSQFGGRNRNLTQLYLSAGLPAAKELISRNPKMSNLDLVVFELAKRIAGNNQFEEAIDLTSDMLAVVPDSAIKLQIEQARAQWRQKSGKGTLAPEFDALAEQVDKKLNIMSLTMPAAIRTLIADPKAVHVVQVTDSCTIDKFNTEEIDMLRQWVADGGILWANNDVLKIFSIGYTSDFWVQGSQECEYGVLPQVCPILTGCSRVVVTKKSKAARNLSYVNVIPLLTCSLRGEKYAYWSLVPYGKGWVSDVKTVDRTKYDGARFWLNFQLFCLGWDIPGAEGQKIMQGNPVTSEPMTPSIQSSNIGASQYARITDTADLNKALDSGAGQQIIWVALTRNEVDLETQKKLRSWISEGGTLWVETDLAESFGFGRLSKVTSSSLSGQAEVARVQDPIVSGLSGAIVNFELDPNGSVIKGAWSIISRTNIRPLLVQPNIQDDIMVVICAARDFGNGFVILRPVKIDSSIQTGKAFESRLILLSSNPSAFKQQTPEPDRRRRSLRTPSRRR